MINITLSHHDTLLFYDSPQLFVCNDEIGTKYICLLSDQTDEYDLILAVPISRPRLKLFLIGSVDLREIILKQETENSFLAKISDYSESTFTAYNIAKSDIKEDWLPDEGLFLNDYSLDQDDVLFESKERSRGIVHLSLGDEGTKYDSKINSVKLAEALLSFQAVVKYAYKKAIKHLPAKKRKAYNNPLNYSLDAFAFDYGSFKVKLQSQSQSNLVGEAEIAKALIIIDDLVANIGDTEKSLELLIKHKGHLANTYIKFLKTITSNNISISYKWGSSANKKPFSKKIPLAEAAELYDLFNSKEYLKEETVEIEGVVEKVDAGPDTWRIIDGEGKKHSGIVSKDASLSLDGIIIMDKKYIFTCKEKILEIMGTGEEKIELQLIEYKEK